MNSFQQIEIRKERNFGEIISVTFEFIRKHFKFLFRILVFVPGPMYLLGGILMALYTYRIGVITQTQSSDPFEMMRVFWIIMLAVLVMVIGTLMLFLAVNEYLVLNLDHDKGEISFKDIWDNVKHSFWHYVGGGLVVGLIVSIGFLFLFIPGIYLGVALIFVLIVISAERKMFGDAIARSFQLIKGNWWSTFGLLIVLSILQVVITYTIMIPVWAVNWISLMFFTFEEMNSGFFIFYSALSTILYYVVAMFVSIIPYVAIAFKYFSIVEEKEEVGMQERIMQMGTTEQV